MYLSALVLQGMKPMPYYAEYVRNSLLHKPCSQTPPATADPNGKRKATDMASGQSPSKKTIGNIKGMSNMEVDVLWIAVIFLHCQPIEYVTFLRIVG